MSELFEGDNGELFEIDEDEQSDREPDISNDPDVLDVNGPINDVLHAFDALRERNREAQHEAKRLGAVMRKAKAELHDRMIEQMGQDSISIKGYASFKAPEPTWYATVTDRAVLQRWARENRPGLLRTREEPKLLNALIRECVRDHRAFPPGLSGYPRKTVSVYHK